MISLSGSQGYILCETLWTMEVRGGGWPLGKGMKDEDVKGEKMENGNGERRKLPKKGGITSFWVKTSASPLCA